MPERDFCHSESIGAESQRQRGANDRFFEVDEHACLLNSAGVLQVQPEVSRVESGGKMTRKNDNKVTGKLSGDDRQMAENEVHAG